LVPYCCSSGEKRICCSQKCKRPARVSVLQARGNNISASKPQVLEVMQPIPPHILAQFNNALHQQAVTESAHGHYRKWLRYFLDFRRKYPPPEDTSEQLRLFIAKLRAKKQQGCTLHRVPFPKGRNHIPQPDRLYRSSSVSTRSEVCVQD
jgi:hypothetical protein